MPPAGVKSFSFSGLFGRNPCPRTVLFADFEKSKRRDPVGKIGEHLDLAAEIIIKKIKKQCHRHVGPEKSQNHLGTKLLIYKLFFAPVAETSYI